MIWVRSPCPAFYSESRWAALSGRHDPSASLAFGDPTLSATPLRGSLLGCGHSAASALLRHLEHLLVCRTSGVGGREPSILPPMTFVKLGTSQPDPLLPRRSFQGPP